MFQPVRPSASLRRRRWNSSMSTSAVPYGTLTRISGAAPSPSEATGITDVGHNRTARSITLFSSRIFPGHRYARSAARASELSSFAGPEYFAHERASAASASRRMSSPRSRRGGSVRATTVSRWYRSSRKRRFRTAAPRSSLVAVTIQMSMASLRVAPSRRTLMSSRTLRSFAWRARGSKPTSSRKSVP